MTFHRFEVMSLWACGVDRGALQTNYIRMKVSTAEKVTDRYPESTCFRKCGRSSPCFACKATSDCSPRFSEIHTSRTPKCPSREPSFSIERAKSQPINGLSRHRFSSLLLQTSEKQCSDLLPCITHQ